MNFEEIIDYSALSTYIECPRKFLFNYMMHLSSLKKNLNLVFGSAWHYGLEKVYKEIKTRDEKKLPLLTPQEATVISTKAFQALWQAEEAPEEWPNEDAIFPKSPGHATNVYYEYWKEFLEEDNKEWQVIGIEEPFFIDLSKIKSGLPSYIGRMDLILQNREKPQIIKIIDHKSAKMVTKITNTSYQTSFQTLGYVAAGGMFFNQLPSMEYNVALFQKSKIAFHRYLYNIRKAQVNDFFHELISHVERLLNDIKQLHIDITELTDRNDSLNCFARNRGIACTSYMSPCRYFDLCQIRNNPLDWFQTLPQGFARKEWNPNKHEKEIRNKIRDLEG